MPIQAPQWTDYLNCPVCCREFGPPPRSPISLACGHTLCRHCLKHLHRKQCPYDQTVIQIELEDLVVNTALLQLAGYTPPSQPYHPPCIQALPEVDREAYDVIVRSMEHLAVYLKYCGNVNNGMGSRLSRPMQRKLVTLLQCAMTDEEGRERAVRAARSLGERTVTELILQHQNSQQLSANLWAAVRARGCQFLGPAMQEEVLKLVLLALEDGSALSRKVLVMFVVQRLEPHFPQASKTSIGHVVQLLYRASCFKVSKRECDSSLMQLKEEFRTYESLRREHDAQIVQIATEAGLRIAPDQWSALLYGDTTHKSHMQSIIDKLQTPQSFAQSIQELFIALQRTGDPAQLGTMSIHLDRLANIDPSPDAKSPSWRQLADVMASLKEVVSRLIHYLQHQASNRDANHNPKYAPQERCIEPSTSQPSPQTAVSTPTHTKYKVSMCRDTANRSFCPRGNTCTFAHSEEELERYRSTNATNGNYPFMTALPSTIPMPPPPLPPISLPQPMYPRFPLPQHPTHAHMDNYNHPPSMPAMPNQALSSDILPNPDFQPDSAHNVDGIAPSNYASSMLHSQSPLGMNQNGIMISVSERPYYGRFSGILTIHEEPTNNLQYTRPDFTSPMFQTQASNMPYQAGEQNLASSMTNIFVPIQHDQPRNISPFPFEDFPSDDYLLPDYRVKLSPAFTGTVQLERRPEPTWPPGNDLFHFDNMRNAMPRCSTNPEDMFNVTGDRRAVGADRLAVVADRLAVAATSDLSNRADDELEEELQALERRIDTEFKSTD
ncbi:roquin-1 isoform X2 [Galleria mellonella]|uniref:RING-type E3 ubiquitin transferase n=1 Tax=Galleria mellonella TaxID=7137 RepID=A0A6J1WQD3_GALME|nr:roquin-1 isoform X2 [Galleria mellonella]